MRVVISDSSCLIDLHKVGLLKFMFSLPYSFVIPQPLFDEELLSISEEEKQELLELGMEVMVLPGEQVMRAVAYFNENRRLKLNDCFALVMAQETDEAILFTGDGPLRALAETKDVEVHGVLWATDMFEQEGCVEIDVLLQALEIFLNDPLVRLPEAEIRKRIRSLKNSV